MFFPLLTSRESRAKWLLWLMAGFTFAALYSHTTTPYVPLGELTSFVGEKPHQYRILLPALVHALRWFVPLSLDTLYLTLVFGASVWAMVEFERILRQFLPDRQAFAFSFFLLYPLFWNYAYFSVVSNPCDIPAIALFLAAINAIVRKRWLLLVLLFAAATINRETSIFILLAFVLLSYDAIGRKTLSAYSLIMAGLWLGIKGGLTILLQDNRGSTYFWNSIEGNLSLLDRMVHGEWYLWIFLGFTFGGLHWLSILAWRSTPVLLKRLTLLAVPFFAVMFVAGHMIEVRIYNELNAIFAAVGAVWFARMLEPHLAKPTAGGVLSSAAFDPESVIPANAAIE